MTTAKKAAAAPAKKAAATASGAKDDAQTTENTTTPGDETGQGDGDQGENDGQGDGGSTAARSGAVESGPQTGVTAPPENAARPPATIVDETPGAAPLDPPADQHLQRQPELGHPTSSTDHTYAEVGGQTIAGENLVAIVNQEGDSLDPDNLFEDPGTRFTHMVSKERVYERFTYPNSTTVHKRLLFPKGARVPRAQAVKVQAAAKADIGAAAASQSE